MRMRRVPVAVLLLVLATGCSVARVQVPAPIEGAGPIISETFSSKGRLEWRVFSRECRAPSEHARAQCRMLASGSVPNTVVDAGRAHIVNVMRGQATFAHFHALSISTATVQNTDVGCPSELTTEYTTDNVRGTGTQAQGDTVTIFRTVGSNPMDTAVTIRKFCLMSTAAVGTGVPWTHILLPQDVPVSAGQTVTTTYEVTVN